MVNIQIPQVWLYMIIGAILGAIIWPLVQCLILPWKRMRQRIEDTEKGARELKEKIDKSRQEFSTFVEQLQISLEAVRTMEERVRFIADKIGLKGDLFAWGRLLFLEGKLDEAIESLSELLKSEPSNDTARFYRGLCYLRKGKRYSKNAVEDLRMAVEGKTGDPDRRLALSRAYLQAGIPSKAEDEANEAVKHRVSDRLGAKDIAGNARLLRRDYDGAISIFKECSLTHTPAVIGWGQALIEKAREAIPEEEAKIYTELISLYDEAIELNPAVSDYYAYRGQAYAERDKPGDWERALKDWEEAKVTAPRSTRPRELKGDSLCQRAAALPSSSRQDTMLRDGLKEYGESLVRAAEQYKAVIRNKRSRVYQLLGEFPSALSEAEAGVSENPDYVVNFMAWATAAISAFAWKKAIEAATSGLEVGKKTKSRGGIIWCLLFRIIGYCGDHQAPEDILEDCKRLVDEFKNFPDFDPALWEWSVAKERLEQAMKDWPADVASISRKSIALVEKDLPPSQYQQEL